MKKLLIQQKQIIFFGIAGALSAFVEIGFFKVFSIYLPQIFSAERDFHGIHFPLSNVLSTGGGIITNYFLSIWFVFERGRHSKKREFAYFMFISLFSTILSLVFFQVFFRSIFTANFDFGIFVLSREISSKIAAIVVVSVLNYTLKKKVIFNG